MRPLMLICIAALALAACGVDGQPTYSTQTTIGFNSDTGAFNNTRFGVTFGG